MANLLNGSNTDKRKKLDALRARAEIYFAVAGAVSMLIAIIGAVLKGIAMGSGGSEMWGDIVFLIFGIVAGTSCLSAAVSRIMVIMITIIQLKSKSLTWRFAISAFFANGLALIMAILLAFTSIWCGIKL